MRWCRKASLQVTILLLANTLLIQDPTTSVLSTTCCIQHYRISQNWEVILTGWPNLKEWHQQKKKPTMTVSCYVICHAELFQHEKFKTTTTKTKTKQKTPRTNKKIPKQKSGTSRNPKWDPCVRSCIPEKFSKYIFNCQIVSHHSGSSKVFFLLLEVLMNLSCSCYLTDVTKEFSTLL